MLSQPISLYALILTVGAIQAIFLISSMVISGKRRKANHVLAFFIALFAYDLIYQLLIELDLIQFVPQIVLFESSTDLLFGPLLYIYIKLVTGSPVRKKLSYIKHFMPVIIFDLVIIAFVTTYSTEQIQEFITLDSLDYYPLMGIVLLLGTLAGICSMVIYFILAFSAISKHQKRVDDNFSYHEKLDLQWLKNILLLVLVLFLVYLFWFMSAIFTFQDSELWEKALFITLTLIIFYLGFRGISQAQVFSSNDHYNGDDKSTMESNNSEDKAHSLSDAESETVTLTPASYVNSSLGTEESKLIIEELKQLIEENQYYLNPTLTLKELADLSGFKMHYISQAINQNENINFFGFINQYRIEHAKQLLLKSAESSPNILNIAMESGFNSKSSFYTTFKKLTDMTPIQYRKKMCTAHNR